jgi:hypothetical protein
LTNTFPEDGYESFSVFNDTVQNYTLMRNIPIMPDDYLNLSLIRGKDLYDIKTYTKLNRGHIYKQFANFFFNKIESLPCPYICLLETEYNTIASINTFSTGLQQGNKSLNGPNTIDGFISRDYYNKNNESKTMYFVCYETFIKITRKSPIKKSRYLIKGLITLILTSLSIICIIICFVVYTMSANTQSLPSKVFRLALCHVLLAQIIFQFGVERTSLPFPVCAFIGVLTHFLWLSAVFFLNAFCVLVASKLQAIRDDTRSIKYGLAKTLLLVYGSSACFTAVNVTYSKLKTDTIGYGRNLCYIDEALMRSLLFALPIFCTVVVNCFVYLYIIFTIKSTSNMAGRKSRDVTYATVYFRLLLLTGITWVFGFLNEYFESDVLDYCFIVLIGGQGIFLLAAFYAGRLCCKIKRMRVYKAYTNDTNDKNVTKSQIIDTQIEDTKP